MTGRVFSYILNALDARRGPSAETQKRAIEAYCQRQGIHLTGLYVDPSTADERSLRDRTAGGRLWLDLRRGDHVVVARADRLGSAFPGLAQVLDAWVIKIGVVLHLLDVDAVLDPANPDATKMIRLIAAFAELGRSMQAHRTRNALAERKSEGRRFTRIAPYGFKWRRSRKHTVMVPVESEQRIMRQVATLRLDGYSIDEIRQYLSYEWQVRNRAGNDFGTKEIAKLATRGAELLRAEKLEVG